MNSKSSWRLAPLMILLGLMILVLPGVSMARPIGEESNRPEDKIEPLVLEQLNSESETDFFVWMTEKADLSQAAALKTKTEKGEFVFNTLRETAERTQKDVRAYLDQQQMPYRAFYIANKIYVRSGNLEAVLALAAREDVAKITANHQFQLQEPFINPRAPETPDVVEPNISFVNADDVWTLGYTGVGIVLAGNDTGLDWDHPALINQYRGWNGSSADHNYNWWDATNTYPTVPGDGHGHGTHTTGTMVGDDGAGNQIGVAPGAKTIHCKNMTDGGGGDDFTFTECFEWDLAPWDLSGNNPNPALAPHAINNSWGYWGGNSPQFEDEIAALRAAGIVVEVSAGNEGPSCSTLRSPGDYAQSLTTGSVNHTSGVLPGTLTGFSSRGPSALYPGDFIPDIMAPGENIRSSVPGGGYQGGWSGTSMSGPHVTALVALMWDASPNLEGDVISTEQIMIDTAVPLTGQNGSNCGGDYTIGPNNDWGYGTMDALAAVEEAIVQGGPFRLEASPESLAICAPANAVYTIDVLQNDPTFTDPVSLAATGNPGGTTVNFSVNPVTPPGSSNLTIGNTGSGTPGSYDIAVTGMGPTTTQTVTVGLDLYDAVPGALTLVAPADGATNVNLRPMYQWTAASQAGSYYLEVAEDNGFSVIVYTATTDGTSHQPNTSLDPLTTYYWRVTASNTCGTGATSSVFSFETRDIPPILLVDDDDNAPDVRSYYTDALDALGAEYDVWDTNNSDNEPSAAELSPYTTVIWFTGVEFGGAAGPGSAGETALASWLDNGGCLFISTQDYLYDRGQTPFMSNYLGMASGTSDVGQTSVTGAGSVYSGLGPYSLTYPFFNYSDRISPDGTAELAFSGNQGDAAINKDSGVYRTTFWGFPFEAISTTTEREAAMQTTLNWCGALGPTGTLAGTVTDLDSSLGISGATITAVGPGTFMATTNSSGAYSRVLPVGTYDVTASAPNYAPVTVNNVVITDGATTVQDFQLQGSALTYSPAFIEESMEIGDVVSNTVTVTNTGPLPIDWSVTIGNWGDPTALRIIPRTITTQDASDFSQPAVVGPASVRSPQGRSTLASQPATPFAWANGASMPSGVVRYGHTQCADQPDSYYVISGVDSNFSVTNGAWRYDANTDSWATLASIPTGQEGTAAVCYAGNIYVAGGGGTNQMFIYNIAGNSWSTGAAVPRNVWGAAIGAWDGKVYLIGGDSDFSFGGTSNQVNIYDIASNTWTGAGANMPTAAVTAGSVQAGQYVYVVGGWGDASPGSNVNVTQRYDMSANSWETGPTFTSARADLALAVTSSNLYAIAGDGNGGGAFDPVALVESLDHTAWPGGAWTNISDPLPTAVTAVNGGFCTGAMAGGEIWAPGGYTGSAIVNTNPYRPSESCFTGGTPWAYAVPNSGTIPANSTATFEVVFDAVSLYQVGDYTAELSFSGTFVNVVPSMPLTMHLSCPSCGFLEGDITDSVTGDPVNASINITNTSGFDVTLSGSSYAIAVQPGTYYLTVTANGYLGDTGTAVVTQGNTTVLDFALDPAIAILSYSPPAVEESMEIGDVVSNTVTVTNTGFIDLEFEVSIGGYIGPLMLTPVNTTPLGPTTLVTVPAGRDTSEAAENTAVSGQTANIPATPAWSYQDTNQFTPNATNVLIACADDTPCEPLGSILLSYPDIGIVDAMDVRATTPTLGDLLAYDVVVTWSNYPYADPIAMGNVLADYVDAGGAVVHSVFNWYGSPFGLAGRFMTDGYSPFISLSGNHFLTASLGAYDPSHPIMAGVTSASDYYRDYVDLAPDAELVASWNDGEEFVATKGSVVAINSYTGIYYLWTGDMGIIFHNAVNYALSGGAPGWAYAVPESDTVPPFSVTTFELVFDASSMYQVGDYYATLSFSGNFVNVVDTMPLTMHLSCPSCGFLEGNIFDDYTGDPLDADIHITSTNGFDVTLSGQSYSIAVQPGVYNFTVEANGYFAETAAVTAVAGVTTTTDFHLTPMIAFLEYSPSAIEEWMEFGDIVTNTVTVTNTGYVDLNFSVNIGGWGGPSVTVRPHTPTFDPVTPLVQPGQDLATNTAGLGLPQAALAAPLAAGDVLDSWVASGVPNPWGIALDGNDLWISSPVASWGGNGTINRFGTDGTPGGVSYPYTWGPTNGPADAAFNWNTGMVWVMDVGLDNCIHEVNPATGVTGNTICPAFSTSQRGLAYDPSTDTYLAGGWNDLTIYRFASDGTILEQVPVGLSIAGLAYNPDTMHLFVMVNASPNPVYVLDAANNYAVVGQFNVSQGFADFSGAGLEFDCDGNLWAVDQAADIVYLFESGESASLCGGGWAYAVPDSGTVPPMSSATFDVVFDASSLYQVGDYTASLSFSGNFANVVPSMPLTMHLSCPSCGFLEGDITDAWTNDPLDADIHVTGPGGFDVTLSGSSYALAVQPGTYDFVVSANGYFDETASVTVAAGQTVVTDFALTPIVSILEYSPASFEHTVALGQVLTDSLDIYNAGSVAFDFELSDNELGRPTLASALISVPAGLSAENAAADTAVSGHAAGASPARTYQAIRPFSPTATNVLIACADDTPCEPLGSILLSYPDIGIVDMLDVRTTTPTLGDLLAYDVVVTWSNYQYADSTAMGNVLADYVDAGGAVVHSVFNWSGTWGLGGRFVTDGYSPLTSLNSGNHYSTANLGTYDPSHPLMAGVTSASDYYRDYVDLTAGATLVASWDDGEEFVAAKDRVVGINSYTGIYYLWTGDIGVIFHNAINYVGLTDALWLIEDPATGTVNPGDTETVNIIFDTTVITQTGTYTAEIRFAGTFDNNVPAAQVVMHVIDDPVYSVAVDADPDAQSGDAGDTIAYTVWITNTGTVADIYTLSASDNSWNTTLSANSILLNTGESDYVTVWVDIPTDAMGNATDTVTIEAASTSSSASGSVDLTTSVTPHFAMTMSGNMTDSGAPGSTVMYSITITNTGNADDTYNLSLGTHTWTGHFPGGNSVNVAAGASATVMLHVTIPTSATNGQSDAVTVTVTSTHDSGVTGSATMTTTAVVTSYTIYMPILMKP